ncbi:hypothetical protein [Luteolibacter sp.]|uniref:hypothetical protein n=1 Tax=Luteolibacter sp. TaxID=1962973 RepID=UPI00326410CC
MNIFKKINPQVEKLREEGMNDYANKLDAALYGGTGSEILLDIYSQLKSLPEGITEERADELNSIKIEVKNILNEYNWPVD